MTQEFQGDAPRPSRREVLRRAFKGGAAAGLGIWAWSKVDPSAWADESETPGRELIIRNLVPLDAETPVTSLGDWTTPNDLFFVRSHFGAPAIGPEGWRLEINGLVDRPIELGLDDLSGLEQVRMPVVLQCAGNGRGLYRPNIPGIGWAKGAVGNAEWTGVRLADLLDRAGVQAGAKHIHLHGADLPPHPKTPPFLRSIPMARAIDPTTIVATQMNGEPLPALHGGPLRLVVPCWTANHSVKWLRAITVAEDEAPASTSRPATESPESWRPLAR